MPIYEFVCMECDEVFERILSRMSDSQPCPVCGAGAKRKLSTFGFTFSQGLKELRSSAYIRGTNIKLEDVHKRGLIPAAKNGDKEAARILTGGKHADL